MPALFPFPTCHNRFIFSIRPSLSFFFAMRAAVDWENVIKGAEEECLLAIPLTLCAVCLLADTADFDPQWHTVCLDGPAVNREDGGGRWEKLSIGSLGNFQSTSVFPVFSSFSVHLELMMAKQNANDTVDYQVNSTINSLLILVFSWNLFTIKKYHQDFL